MCSTPRGLLKLNLKVSYAGIENRIERLTQLKLEIEANFSGKMLKFIEDQQRNHENYCEFGRDLMKFEFYGMSFKGFSTSKFHHASAVEDRRSNCQKIM